MIPCLLVTCNTGLGRVGVTLFEKKCLVGIPAIYLICIIIPPIIFLGSAQICGCVQNIDIGILNRDKAFKKRGYCEHCGDYVSKTLYYQHRWSYYNENLRVWCQERVYQYQDGVDEPAAFSLLDTCVPSKKHYHGNIITYGICM